MKSGVFCHFWASAIAHDNFEDMQPDLNISSPPCIDAMTGVAQLNNAQRCPCDSITQPYRQLGDQGDILGYFALHSHGNIVDT